MEFRFPGMRGAPLLESRVCQYENSPDHHLIIDRHPEIKNVWLVGGGSGHGFKYSPAVGEHVASMILEGQPPEPFIVSNPSLSLFFPMKKIFTHIMYFPNF